MADGMELIDAMMDQAFQDQEAGPAAAGGAPLDESLASDDWGDGELLLPDAEKLASVVDCGPAGLLALDFGRAAVHSITVL